MNRSHKGVVRVAGCLLLFLVLGAVCLVRTGQSQDEALSISCFFCHMEIIAEMKAHAVKHWEAETKCEACHGVSMEHLDVEDNSVKPDKVWTDATVHQLCGECHQGPSEAYLASSHSKLALQGRPGAAKAPSCSNCHGYHGLKSQAELKQTCLSCHLTLPAACTSKSTAEEQNFPCKGCHDSHSLRTVNKN